MMGNLGENLDWEDVKQMVRDADFDGDGKINYDDFVKMMMNWLDDFNENLIARLLFFCLGMCVEAARNVSEI